MTSKQVMLCTMLLCCSGCALLAGRDGDAGRVDSPYSTRRVWAVAPLRNESGSGHADGIRFSEALAEQLQRVVNVDVLAVNRCLAAMESLEIAQVTAAPQAHRLMKLLGADGLVIGSITVYEPYDPPAMGLAIELYGHERAEDLHAADPRVLSRSAVPPDERGPAQKQAGRPVSAVAGVYRASEPHVRRWLRRYARRRGPVMDDDAWHRYRISTDLYTRFVAHVMARRLVAAETARIARVIEAQLPAP
jgi:hypothetical protein